MYVRKQEEWGSAVHFCLVAVGSLFIIFVALMSLEYCFMHEID